MYVNKQNCRIWGFANLPVIEVRLLHPGNVTVWCALCFLGVIGKRRWNDCHRQLRALWLYDNRLFFLPAVEEYNLESMWFQQDGATCHTTRANMALLQETVLTCHKDHVF